MKCYNKRTYEKLGFDVIRAEVAKRALGPEAREEAQHLGPIDDRKQLLAELQQVNELREVLLFDDPFPLNRIPAMARILDSLRLEGSWVPAESLSELLSWLVNIKDTRAFLHSRREKYPALYQLIQPLGNPKALIEAIDAVIDERGEIRDNASPDLVRIRKEIRSASNEVRVLLNRVLRKAQEKNWTDAPEITLRNDRLVVPVKAENKSRISGFVQDVSSSGNTVFVEPTEALSLNNRLRELQIREQNELVRILMEIASEIREHLDELSASRKLMIRLDLVRARAKLAVDLNAVLPAIASEGKSMRLQMAFYPLLLLKALQDEFEVVPLDLGLNPQQRILVISGPNAGGKSVSLKTVGLLQLMLQSGLLVPVDERSEFRLFDALFLQIGDEQSVESDLSTYTSHLYQLRLMGDNMNENSLFLIDEFGSGTDPKLGGAIAEAFLERFLRQGAYGIITTHYSNIKEYAETEKQIANGAMQFDTEELKPTYRLVEGLPGRSYAFEIAKRVGVHFTILRKAQRKIGRKQMTSEQLLAQLEEKNQQMEKIIRENEVKEARLNRLLSENEILQSELTRKRKQMLRDAQQEARNLIKDANKKIENTIREIRERQAERVATRRLRKSLEEATPELTEVPSAPQEKKREEHPAVKIIPGEKPEAGDYVRLKNSRSYGKLVELQGNRGVVEVGDVRLTVKLKELHKVEPPKSSKKQKQVSVNFQRSLGTARVELDVMGQRVEEALVEVEKLVDEAMLAGLTYLRILHGKGSGALREGIRNYLQDHEAVMSIKDAAIEAGGAGWTIVELKEQG